MTNMVKVLIRGSKEYPIGTSNDNIPSGGMEYDIARLVPELAKRDVKVHIVTREFKGVESLIWANNIFVYRVPWIRGRFTRNYSFNINSLFKAYDIIMKNDIKVIHSVGVVASFMALILKVLTGAKVFAEPLS